MNATEYGEWYTLCYTSTDGTKYWQRVHILEWLEGKAVVRAAEPRPHPNGGVEVDRPAIARFSELYWRPE